MTTHRSLAELEAELPQIQASPRDAGTVDLIIRRPATGERERLELGELCPERGLVGDRWALNPKTRGPDGALQTDTQLTLMSRRCVEAIAGPDRDRWALAGDQLYVEFDLSEECLPAGARLQVGAAVVEVTAEPHTGCGKFVERFGKDAMRFVNSPGGRKLRLRGVNTRVITGGVVREGDAIRPLPKA